MLTTISIRHFKQFDDVTIPLDRHVVFIGPNNSGKTTALQALMLWHFGLQQVLARRDDKAPPKRSGVTLNRQDLTAIPVPQMRLLWRNTRTSAKTQDNVLRIAVEGTDGGASWQCALQFTYQNNESFYCRPVTAALPAAVNDVKMAFLPPMSGLVALEDKLERGSIFRRIGEGTTANVLRNLCYQLWEDEQAGQSAYWTELTQQLQQMFGVVLLPPQYHRSSGIITMLYKDQSGVELDLSAAGRGMLQILLLLSYLYNHPGAVLLLDEPDAHLEILRQGEIYRRLTGIMRQMNAQVIMATHSEELMNEAAGQEDTLIAFVGRPHRINDHSSRAQVAKALRDIPYHDYYKALQTGWILYLEGRSDLIILQKLARTLHHPGADYLERVFVYEVKNQPAKARDHFYALREAKSDLQGLALFDRLKLNPTEEPLRLLTWRKREIEIYLCQYTTLLAYATAEADPDRQARQQAAMEKAVQDVSSALEILGKPSPWSADIKASDEVLIPIFKKYFASLGQPNMMQHKADFALLIPFITPDSLDPEVVEKLNAILDVAQQARPGESHHP